MQLKCKRQGCEREWEYKGKSKFYASCPQCKSSVRIRKPKEEKEDYLNN